MTAENVNLYVLGGDKLDVGSVYNRLSLIIGLILDIDMALYSICLPWEVKYNKSWGTIFAIKYFFHT